MAYGRFKYENHKFHRSNKEGITYGWGDGMKSIDYYKCRLCEYVWAHEWDTKDYNNDFTQCPNCGEFEFDEITTHDRSRKRGKKDEGDEIGDIINGMYLKKGR